MGEIRGEWALDLGHARTVTMDLGIMRQIRGSVIGYCQAGRTLYSDEGAAHTFLGAGLKVLIKPSTKDEKRSRPRPSVVMLNWSPCRLIPEI